MILNTALGDVDTDSLSYRVGLEQGLAVGAITGGVNPMPTLVPGGGSGGVYWAEKIPFVTKAYEQATDENGNFTLAEYMEFCLQGGQLVGLTGGESYKYMTTNNQPTEQNPYPYNSWEVGARFYCGGVYYLVRCTLTYTPTEEKPTVDDWVGFSTPHVSISKDGNIECCHGAPCTTSYDSTTHMRTFTAKVLEDQSNNIVCGQIDSYGKIIYLSAIGLCNCTRYNGSWCSAASIAKGFNSFVTIYTKGNTKASIPLFIPAPTPLSDNITEHLAYEPPTVDGVENIIQGSITTLERHCVYNIYDISTGEKVGAIFAIRDNALVWI